MAVVIPLRRETSDLQSLISIPSLLRLLGSLEDSQIYTKAKAVKSNCTRSLLELPFSIAANSPSRPEVGPQLNTCDAQLDRVGKC